MNFIRLVIRQPITVAVAVLFIVMSGLIAVGRIPIQLTPNVDDTIIAVTTRWEGASPDEIEREIVDPQEEKLQGLSSLRAITSESTQGQGLIRLEFEVGTSKEVALREVSDKLREVPDYPENADEPVVEATDPENIDYIAWIVLSSSDPELDIRTLQDFTEDRVEPVLERVSGVSEVNTLGGREREAQIRFDPVGLAQLGITPDVLVAAIQRTNRNVSAGELADAKFDVRLRTVSQFATVSDVEDTVITYTEAGPVFIRDVAEVVETYKEATSFVRSRGEPVIAINVQREPGSNVMEVMEGVRAAIAGLNQSGGALETHARTIGLDGALSMRQVYDQTIYIDDALALVRNNIWLGGGLAILVLVIFLRSIRSVAIIALAIPISVMGSIVVMVALGRSINVVSLAGMAFAIGLVVDNAIVVLENVFRHLEMGKPPMVAAYDGAREVWGAILASTLTTICVFVPILLVEEEAGQLFRDIALAICASVGLSLLVSISVIPTSAGRLLRPITDPRVAAAGATTMLARAGHAIAAPFHAFGRVLHAIPEAIGGFIYAVCGSTLLRVLIVVGLTTVSLVGSWWLMPAADYLPQGNRNLVFGLLIPPPGYNINKQIALGKRVEETIAPFYEAGMKPAGSTEYDRAAQQLPSVPTFDWMTGGPGDPVTPPPLENYFLVSRGGVMFHGGMASEPSKVPDVQPLFQHATRADRIPGVLAFAFQVPLFRLGGSTGSAIKIDLSGDDLAEVAGAAGSVYMDLGQRYGFGTVQPSPSNFNIFSPEIRIVPNKRRLADLGMTPADLALAVQASGDGAIIGEYRLGGDTIDLKLIAKDAVDRTAVGQLGDLPIASPAGLVVPLQTIADVQNVNSPPQINHVGRRRSITLQFTPPEGIPLEQAVNEVAVMLEDFREQGRIGPAIETGFAGSASKLESVRRALLGDGTFLGTANSSLALALAVTYLLMCVLFQSFVRPLVIMFSVPLATLGGFLALRGVYVWSLVDRYLPVQKLDVLTMLGFVILIGIVVNNAILIVHQSRNFMLGLSESGRPAGETLTPRRAIAEAVRTRVRPIFMSTLTSVGAMLPLVLMPGSGSELYRGLGSVVVGGLLVSTVFTLLLVPVLLSLVEDAARRLGVAAEATPRERALALGAEA